MKKLFIILLFLSYSPYAFGMKRHLRPQLQSLLSTQKYTDFFSIADKYKHLPLHTLFNKDEKKKNVEPIKNELLKNKDEKINLEQNILRKSWKWLLPSSAALLIASTDPLLVGTSLAGITFGSFGLKRQCDLIATKMNIKELTTLSQKLHNFFGIKEEELETK